jgi:outer membrane protein OmpA-like peptidoglycan-associated protein
MKRNCTSIAVASAIALAAACSSTPEQIPELDMAKTIVPQVEASARAGVAAANISEARKALDRANELHAKGKDVEDIKFEASVATANAQIANTKIDTAQAREEIEKGTALRQQVLLDARTRETERVQQELKDLQAKQTERGMVVTLGDVLFDTGKAVLKPGAYTTVDRLAHVLNSSHGSHVVIEGHTDSMGSDANNQALSQRRAQAVESALLERGVSASQISSVGKGETTPVASNDTASGRQANRRVELIFSQDASRVATDSQ